MPGLTKIEQETIITFNELEKTASIFTYNQKLKTKLMKLAAERANDVQGLGNTEGAISCTVPKGWIKISPPQTRSLTAEESAAFSERMKKAQAAKREKQEREE